MPNVDDFHAFQSTTGGSSGGSGCSGGCLNPTIITIVVIVAILYIVGKLFGWKPIIWKQNEFLNNTYRIGAVSLC